MPWFILLLLGVQGFLYVQVVPAEPVNVLVDADHQIGKLQQFWKSTGLCPPDPHSDAQSYLLSRDMQQNLAWVGSIPRGDHDFQVRVHWMLELVTVHSSLDGHLHYNFTLLDAFVAELVERNDLKPGFELMGNPSHFFTDFEDRQQVFLWKDLISAIGRRYTEKYGIDLVKKWNFETWNEPLLHQHFDDLNMTVQGFLNYYDACSLGLRETSSQLQLGGPGGECRDPTSNISLCWPLLEHCNNGTDYFTKRRGPLRLDYISLHKKGEGAAAKILELELTTLSDIHRLYHNLQNISIFNNEADPMVTWSKPYWWRQDATYAAVATKVLAQHIDFYFSSRHKTGVPFALLSNDNAFLSYYPYVFSQRTLLARFQVNNTTPKHVQFIRKPILSVMALWNKLGEEIISVKVSDENRTGTEQSQLGVVATITRHESQSDFQMAVLLYQSNDTSNATGETDIKVTINLPSSLVLDNAVWVQYTVDNKLTNPLAVWEKRGKPAYPSDAVYREMRAKEEPYRHGMPSFLTGLAQVQMNLTLALPGISVIHICQQKQQPQKIVNLRFIPVFEDQIIIAWKGLPSKCILTYEVEASSDGIHFQRINEADILFSAYHYNCNKTSACTGFYRIRGIDYWNRTGPFSDIQKYTNSATL